MKLSKFQVTAILYFKSGLSKRVDWVEDKLVKRSTIAEEVRDESLTLEDAKQHISSQMSTWVDQGDTVVKLNAKGEHSIIAFTEVEYTTVSVKELKESAPPTEGVNPIFSHPAFTPSNSATPYPLP